MSAENQTIQITPKEIARRIATDILLAGSHTNGKATRIALRVGDGGGVSTEKDNGGLCEAALVDVIANSLRSGQKSQKTEMRCDKCERLKRSTTEGAK